MARCEQQFSGKFKGDGEAMLSALIRACEVKPISPAANPAWAGRELVPWTDDSVQVEACLEFQPLETSSRRSAGKFPEPSSTHKQVRPARASPDSPQHKKAQAKRSKVGSPPRSPPRSISPRISSSSSSSSSVACACPALAASPKPEKLPMPTTGLLSRAFVRGRSPSPPKDAAVASFFAYHHGQQLVRAVAA
ncbi:hypothetical protein OEZ85_010449 [Tetradesmus obliquus]|uniref:Uncharacterized protein n=1 Tax=Tetradesmus obliquus TaxID=3088 RepID=A0ABY8TMW4_TETOB|nr:hypothetical protein OEZ85_010449 [Tetradesmus obliquus]